MGFRNGHLEMVKYLLSLRPEFNIDPTAQNNFAIVWAAANGHLEMVKYLSIFYPNGIPNISSCNSQIKDFLIKYNANPKIMNLRMRVLFTNHEYKYFALLCFINDGYFQLKEDITSEEKKFF